MSACGRARGSSSRAPGVVPGGSGRRVLSVVAEPGPGEMSVAEFTAIVREFRPRLRAYVLARLPASEVDDVVAEVLMVLWRRRRSLPSSEGERAGWIFGVARRCVLAAGRSLRRRAQVALVVGSVRGTAAHAEDPATAVEGSRGAEDLLGVLSQEQAVAMRLVVAEDRSVQDVAAALGISSTALTSRLHRARRALAEQRGPADPAECEPDHSGRA